MRILVPLLVLAPLAAGAIFAQQDAQVVTASQAPFAVLSSGDQGTANIMSGGTQASVSVSDTAILVADDVLDITSSDASWNVRALYISHTGFNGLTASFTLSLGNGLLNSQQIRVAGGAVTQTMGALVELPAGDTELRAATTLLTSGTVTLELVITHDGGGATLRYPVTVRVT